MNPMNWYKPQPSVQDECRTADDGKKFIHMRFELPDTAPLFKKTFSGSRNDNEFTICVNLESDFARDFFRDSFIAHININVCGSIVKKSSPPQK
jgi:hypothetical protein